MGKSASKKTESFDKQSIPIIVLFLVLLIIGTFLFFYWRKERGVGEPEEDVTITATIFPIYDMAQNIIGDNEYVSISQIIPSDIDPLTFSPSDNDIQSIKDSDVTFKVGAGYDEWMNSIEGEGRTVDLSSFIDLIEAQSIEPDYKGICEDNGGEWLSDYSECTGISQEVCEENKGEFNICASPCRHDEDSELCIQLCVQVCIFDEELDDEQGYDPYFWMSIENAKIISKVVYEELARLKPGYQEFFYSNLQSYLESLDETKTYITEQVETSGNWKIITYRNNLEYFTQEYDIEVIADFSYEAKNSSDPSTEKLSEIEDLMNTYIIQDIFADSFSDYQSVQNYKWDKVINIEVYELIGGGDGTSSYIDLMRWNANVLTGSEE